MTATLPEHVPDRLQVGLTWKWLLSLDDYLPSAGWTVTYRFARSDSHFEVVGADNGDGRHAFTVSVATSAQVKDGHWVYSAFAEKDGEKVEVDYGQRDITPSLDGDVDRRSMTKKLLDACEAAILAKKTGDVATVSGYTYRERSLTEYALAELYEERRRLQSEYSREQARELAAAGRAPGTKVRTRFIR